MRYRFSFYHFVVIGLVALCAYQTYAATRRANQGTFFHLSDWHIDPFYDANETSSDFCRKPIVLDDIENVLFPEQFYSHSIYNKKWYSALLNTTGPNYEFGQYGCDSPRLLAEIALNNMVAVQPKPNFIVYTGDMSAHHLKTPERRLEAIRLGSSLIRAAYPNTTIYPTIGNNDCYPDYFLYLPELGLPNVWLEELWSVWSVNFSIPADQKANFVHGGYYSVDISDSLIFVGLNTMWWSSSLDPSLNTTRHPDPASQFAWLENILISAQNSSKQVYITGHILPTSGYYTAPYFATYLNLVRTYSKVIALQLFAHTHKDNWAQIAESSTSAKAVQAYLTVPSLTPKNDNNPTFRLMYYDTVTNVPLDYDQYYADLMNATYYSNLQFVLEYNFQSLYGQNTCDTNGIAAATLKLAQDLALFNRYKDNTDAQYTSSRASTLCSIVYLDENDQNSCESYLKPFSK